MESELAKRLREGSVRRKEISCGEAGQRLSSRKQWSTAQPAWKCQIKMFFKCYNQKVAGDPAQVSLMEWGRKGALQELRTRVEVSAQPQGLGMERETWKSGTSWGRAKAWLCVSVCVCVYTMGRIEATEQERRMNRQPGR